MAITFKCPACEKMINAPDSAAGLTGPCPYCKTRITAPSAPGAAPTAAAPQPQAPVGVGMAPKPQAPVEPLPGMAPRPQPSAVPPSPASSPYAMNGAPGATYAPRPAAAPEGLNWGAFLLPLFWGIAHNVWISLLCFVPGINLIMPFVLLFKGNEWGWEHRQFGSEEQFRQVQRAWTIWGLIITVLSVILGFIYGVMMGMAAARMGMHRTF